MPHISFRFPTLGQFPSWQKCENGPTITLSVLGTHLTLPGESEEQSGKAISRLAKKSSLEGQTELTIENEYCILSLVLDVGKLDDGMDLCGFGERTIELEVMLSLQKLE